VVWDWFENVFEENNSLTPEGEYERLPKIKYIEYNNLETFI